MFKIIVPSYDCIKWLPRTFDSISSQIGEEFNVCVVDDDSDNIQKDYIVTECINRGWEFIVNYEHKGSLYNQAQAIDHLQPSDEDIILIVDGDDRLFNSSVLKTVKPYYDNGSLMTYGSYIRSDGIIPNMSDYPDAVVNRNRYRRCGGLFFNHLRTFSYSLYKNIDHKKDFMFPDGRWFQVCADTAIMIPCLELAGGTHKFVTDILYEYNVENPISDSKINGKLIDDTHRYILNSLPTKRPLNGIKVRNSCYV